MSLVKDSETMETGNRDGTFSLGTWHELPYRVLCKSRIECVARGSGVCV